MGLVDAVVQGDVEDAAIAFVKEKLAAGTALPSYEQRTDRLAEATDELFDQFTATQARNWSGLFSPWKIVECIKGACSRPLDEMLEAERQAFAECAASSQARALIHLFFAERAAGKLDGGTAVAIGSVGIIGAGTMGAGIAMDFANCGFPVVLVDAVQASLDQAVSHIRSTYDSSVAKGRMSHAKADAALQRISPSLVLEDVARCDLLVEAVFEDLDVKRGVIARLDRIIRPDAIVATNTSTLDIDQLASASARPERVVGMHFFSPAHVMRLLEVVRGAATEPQVLRTVIETGRKLGKIPVVAGNGEGFIGNYILDAYGREMDFLIEDGALPWQVDRVMRDFGFAMGLFEMRDMAGLDVIRRVREQRREWERPGRYPLVADRLWELGRYGQKTGAGYYAYEGRRAMPDPLTERVVEEVAAAQGIVRRAFSDELIRDRLMAVMVNAGARLLETGVAASAADIDLVMVHGYGFPRHRGGPMHWAERQGLVSIRDRLRALAAEEGERLAPARLIETLAAEGRIWPAAA
jgi:3-hydroxyacyl-CoA dehydrogenase